MSDGDKLALFKLGIILILIHFGLNECGITIDTPGWWCFILSIILLNSDLTYEGGDE